MVGGNRFGRSHVGTEQMVALLERGVTEPTRPQE
jgi:hypothetical protein